MKAHQWTREEEDWAFENVRALGLVVCAERIGVAPETLRGRLRKVFGLSVHEAHGQLPGVEPGNRWGSEAVEGQTLSGCASSTIPSEAPATPTVAAMRGAIQAGCQKPSSPSRVVPAVIAVAPRRAVAQRCDRCGGQVVRSHDEASCLQCGRAVLVPARAWDAGGDTAPADAMLRDTRIRVYQPHRGKWLYESATGCHVHDECLTCPLPACVFDTRGVALAAEIRALAKSGMAHKAIALRYGLSANRVSHIVAASRAERAHTVAIREMHAEGFTNQEIVETLGVSMRSVAQSIRFGGAAE